MASAVTPPRQLAPTVGPAAALAGVYIRTGNLLVSGERVVSGLVQRLGHLRFVSDNARCFGSKPLPANGRFIEFGAHEVFVGTSSVHCYPERVVVAADPPALCAVRGKRTTRPAGSVEVMMTAPANPAAAKGGAAKAPPVPTKSGRAAKPALERPENIGEASSRPTPFEVAIERLAEPISPVDDPAAAQLQLEQQRQAILEAGHEIARAQRDLEIQTREYNIAHGFTPLPEDPSRLGAVKHRGKNLNAEIARDGRARSTSSSQMTARPKYSTPAKTMRAAEAAILELSNLTGEPRRRQEQRVKELVTEANRQQEAAARTSSAGGGRAGSTKQASSPHGHLGNNHNKQREKSVNSGRNKQMTKYDPVLAGKQVAGQGYADQNNKFAPLAGQKEAQQNYHPAQQQPRQPISARLGPQANRYDDGNSAMEKAGYPRYAPRQAAGTSGNRLGVRQLSESDTRHKLDRLHLSEYLEEQGPPGPKCFGPRILREPPPVVGFHLPRTAKTYDGSTRPEDWLENYLTAVHVAAGNRRWAVRYVPQMLEGPARLWLNNLPEGSVDCWLDFEEAFVNNFTSTYKRPNRPQQLSMVRQRDNETDREYLTRWSNVRNSCEGVIEAQAISWFSQGCRHGSMLWQKLQREPPNSLAEMIRIADVYAMGDPMQPMLDSAEPGQSNHYGSGFRRNDHNNFRNKRREPDYRYGANQVNAVEQNQPGPGNSQRQKTNGPAWGQRNDGKKPWDGQKKQWPAKYTFESMLDQPCKFHTFHPSRPSNHTTRDCEWMQRAGNVRPQQQLPPPPPLTGANSVALNAQMAQNQVKNPPEAVNQVVQPNDRYLGPDRNEYREHHQSYIIFVTQPDDKQSLRRREMEVNAVMPALPKFMNWSDREITWSLSDHPKVMPNPGGYALVVDPTFIGPDINVKFTKVLIDNGSSINIMYKDTMHKLGIKENMLQPSRTTFHGIVPGLSCSPLGKIRVDVLFGTQQDCRVENIEFEVVDLSSPYHALLGRPALAQFMASTHAAYLKMKMPGPKGIITITGNYRISMQCASASSALAESLVIEEEKKRMYEAVKLAQSAVAGMPPMANPYGTTAFQPGQETKKIVLDDKLPERTVTIGAGLPEK